MGCSTSSLRRQASGFTDSSKGRSSGNGKKPGSAQDFMCIDPRSGPPMPTYCEKAAMEYTERVGAKALMESDHEHHAAEPALPGLRFGASHRELLGRCWDLPESTHLSGSFPSNIAPSVREGLVDGSFGCLASFHTHGGFESPTVTVSSSSLTVVTSFPSSEGYTYSQAQHHHHHHHHQQGTSCSEKNLLHQSQWVSLVGKSSSLWLKTRGATESESWRACTQGSMVSHSNSSVRNSHNTNSGYFRDIRSGHDNSGSHLDQLDATNKAPDSVASGERGCTSTDATECPFTSAKHSFAFRLSEDLSKDSDALFLRRQGFFPSLGVRVRHWNRLELFCPSIGADAIVIAQAQSVNSSFASAFSVPSDVWCRESASSSAISPLRYEGFLFGGFGQDSTFSVEDQRFPKESVYCHCLALPPQFMQDSGMPLDRVPSLSTSFYTSHGNSAGVCEKHPQNAEAGSCADCSMGLRLQSREEYNGVTPAATITSNVSMNNGSQSIPVLLRTRHHVCQSSSATSLHHKPVVASIVVGCFEVSIDPFQWKKNKFARTAVSYNTTKAKVRQRVGNGVVTRVMYGGVCTIQCSSLLTVKELETAMCPRKQFKRKSSNAVRQEIKKIIRDGIVTGDTSSDVIAAGNTNGSYGGGAPSMKGTEAAVPHFSCRIIQCVGGIEFGDAELKLSHERQVAISGLLSPLETKGVGVGINPNGDGSKKFMCGPWMNVRAMAALLHLWAAHVQSNVKFAEPIAVFVQKSTGILPSLMLKSNWFGRLRYLDVENDTESTVSDNDREIGRDGLINLENGNGMGVDMSKFSSSLGDYDGDSEEQGWQTRTNGATMPSARSLPLPRVLYTGRALTIVHEDDATSLSYRKIATDTKWLATPSEMSTNCTPIPSRKSTLPIDRLLMPSTSSEIKKKQKQIKTGVKADKSEKGGVRSLLSTTSSKASKLQYSETTAQAGDEVIQADSGALAGPVRKRVSSISRPSLSFTSGIGYADDNVHWERIMLELRALHLELCDLEETRRGAEEQLLYYGNLATLMEGIFLPNIATDNILPICTYLDAVLDEPGDIPGQCLHLDTADWLPCAAAVLTSPRHAMRVVNVAHALTMQTLPSLGMLAGLLFCEHAMPPLREIMLRCDKLCAHAAKSAAASEKTKPKRKEFSPFAKAMAWSRSSGLTGQRTAVKGKAGRDDTSSIMDSSSLCFGALWRSPTIFLTPKQVAGVLYAFTRAATMNAHCGDFIIDLRNFPLGDPARPKTAARHPAMPHRGKPPIGLQKKDRKEGEEVGKDKKEEKKKKEEEEEPCWANAAAEGLSPERRAVLTAWREAERRAHCMLLRQRRAQRPFGCSSVCSDPAEKSTTTETWCYGLDGYEEERSLVNAAEELLWQEASVIFDEVQRAVNRLGSSNSTRNETPLSVQNGKDRTRIIVRR